MLFNSFEYIIFLPLTFFLYWFVFNKRLIWRNLFLLIISYVFYGWWDWKFLSLIIISSTVDYVIGLKLGIVQHKSQRKILLLVSLFTNLGILFIFKYFNFFTDSFIIFLSYFGISINELTLKVILPVGISFYTFQTLSYTIDVYNKKIAPTTEIINFFAFVSFFPQLVAGPIERASRLLPQFNKKTIFNFNNAIDGLKLIVWGLFKKVVIADNCAVLVDRIFNHSQNYHGIVVVFGLFLFAFQIYCDFSGYSDIAIGTAKLFGFSLMINFRTPYFSRDIAEFWRRWHISLSTWFRDYLYIPLGGSKGKTTKVIRNIFIIFIVSGFWHGANWTFIAWGGLNAIYFVPLYLTKKNRQNTDIVAKNQRLPRYNEFLQMCTTFFLTCLAWLLFRSNDISQAYTLFLNMLSFDYNLLIEFSFLSNGSISKLIIITVLIGFFIIVEWINREKNVVGINNYKYGNRLLYSIIVILIIHFGNFNNQSFIYFQF